MRRTVIVSAILGVVLGAGGVYAMNDANTIHGCAHKSTGALRKVNSPQDCNPGSEVSVDWNIQGPAGQDGQDGQDGTDGTDGVSGYEKAFSGFFAAAAFTTTSLYAECPAGKTALSGGYILSSPDLEVVASDSSADGARWFVTVLNTDSAPHDVAVEAVCATAA